MEFVDFAETIARKFARRKSYEYVITASYKVKLWQNKQTILIFGKQKQVSHLYCGSLPKKEPVANGQ
jgi:hypothetical protein